MVDADPAVDLVVQADLAVRLVLVPRELDPVHPQVRLRQAGPVGVLGVDLRQRDERPAVVAARTGAAAAGRASSCAPGSARGGPAAAAGAGPCSGTPRYRQGWRESGGRADLQLDQAADGLERVAEEEPGPLERAEQVADHRERRPLDPPEEERRPARLVDPALDGGGLQVGVDLRLDRDELPVRLEVVDAFGQRAIAHFWTPVADLANRWR